MDFAPKNETPGSLFHPLDGVFCAASPGNHESLSRKPLDAEEYVCWSNSTVFTLPDASIVANVLQKPRGRT